jgi:hypothetical protein
MNSRFLAWFQVRKHKIFEKRKVRENWKYRFFNCTEWVEVWKKYYPKWKRLHHDWSKKPDDYAAYSYSDTSIGSTCEMLYNFISFLEKKKTSTKQLIRNSNIQAPLGFRNHRKYAPNCFRINRFKLLFENSSSRLQLLGRALQNLVLSNHQTSYTTLTQWVE